MTQKQRFSKIAGSVTKLLYFGARPLANIKSAEKRAAQDVARRAHNNTLRSKMRTAIKKARAAIATGQKDTAEAALKAATPVIDSMVNRIIRYAKSLERKENNFFCGGFAWDVPQLPGDFWDAPQRKGGQGGGGRQITLSFWNGKDTGYQPDGVKFNYPTYSDGHAAFYKELYKKGREAFPGSKFMIEPWIVWDSWFAQIKDRPDAWEITPDLVLQEKDGTEFVDDERIFKTDIISKEFVGCTTPNRVGEKQNRVMAAAAAMNRAWFNWFGRFGGTGDMPGYKNVYEVPARLQLVRRVGNWDNLNNVPLTSRSWDGSVYQSPLSRIDSTVIYSSHPDSGKIFAVWLSPEGKIDLPKKAILVSVFRTDSLFVETSNGKEDIELIDHRVKLINNHGVGKGYILTIKKSEK